MNTIDKVELYKKELADDTQKQRRFNVWAFVFSAWYFFYKDMLLYFLFFILLSVIFCLVLSFYQIVGAVAWGVFISHLIAGFMANRLCRKYKEEYIKFHEGVDIQKKVEYFQFRCHV